MSSTSLDPSGLGLNTLSDDFEGRHLIKAIRWWDGFILALSVPVFLFASLGVSVAVLGAVVAILVWLFSVVIGALQNEVYAELSTMMPNKSGGIGIYANEGLKRYTTFIGPLAVWGYWFGWSTVLSINGLLIGSYLQAEWWPKSDANIVPKVIGTVVLLALWLFNVLGLRPGVWFAWLTGIVTMIPLLIVMIVPFVNGTFHGSNLQTVGPHVFLGIPGSMSTWTIFSLIMTWMYLACWTTYGIECVATFAPEFTDTIRDTPRALRSSAVFSVLVYGLVPLGLVGVVGQAKLNSSLYTSFIPALNTILGTGVAGLIVVFVVASLLLSANVATMDGSRALWQMSRDRMTVTWLGHLNTRGVPDVGMSLDLIVQVALMWIFGSPLAILAASNLGYVLSHVCALSAFVLLRRDQPNAVRPIRRSNIWVPIAIGLAALNALFILIGSWQYNLSIGNLTAPLGDNLKVLFTGIGLLLLAYLLYLFRIYVQDRQSAEIQMAKT